VLDAPCSLFLDNLLLHRSLTLFCFQSSPHENSGIITVGDGVFLSATTVLPPLPFWAIGLTQRLARTTSNTELHSKQ
jgi:hypothetical protein